MLINQGDVEPGFTRRPVVNVAARLDRDDDGRGGVLVHPSSIAHFQATGDGPFVIASARLQAT